MPGTFLDCGCYVGPEGRTWCPSCQAGDTAIVSAGRLLDDSARLRAFKLEARNLAHAVARWHGMRDAMPTEAMMDSWGRLFALAGVDLDEDGTAVVEVR